MPLSLKQQTLRGTVWSGVERFSVQGIQFLILILMARILTPADYGMVGMLAIFLAVSQSLVDSGFTCALIQKLDRSETDYATVFYFNIAVGAVLYFALFFAAPSIARFYDLPQLTAVTRVVSLTLFLNSLTVVPRAILSVRIDFRTQAKASILASVASGAAGVGTAYAGWGVWAIVLYNVSNVGINAALLWLFVRWRPRRVFSGASFRQLFGFGSKLMVSGLIDTVYKNSYTIVIGKRFAAAELGFYTRADQFAQFPSSNLTGILQRVTFPVLSTIQHEDDRLRLFYRKFLCLSAFVVFPMMIGLAVLAGPVIAVLLNETWMPASELLAILCLCCMWYPIHAINLNLLQVKGRSDLFLRLEIIKKAVGVCILCITIPLGVKAMCWGSVVSSLLGLGINTHYTGKLIGVGFLKQMRDLLPTLGYVAVMGCAVYGIAQCADSNPAKLCLGTLGGAAVYGLAAYLTGSDDLKELWLLIRRK